MTSAQGYADRLSDYDNKGDLNLQNEPEHPRAILEKGRILAERIRKAKYVVVHTGAGISTSAGISDFRGPDGVWTKQRRAQASKRPRTSSAPTNTVSFEDAIPTLTHMALVSLQKAGFVHYIISQNVDSLHLRSGFPRDAISELHGDLFAEQCAACNREYIREYQTKSVGLRETGNRCECGGRLRDKALDWEDPLPEPDFELAKQHAADADLNLVLGTSCQMEPARGLPFRGKGGKNSVAIVNLSRTKFDDRFGLRIRSDCDSVFAVVAKELGVKIHTFQRHVDVVLHAPSVEAHAVLCSLSLADEKASDARIPGIQRVRYQGEGEWTDFSDTPPFKATLDYKPAHVTVETECTDGQSRLLILDYDVKQKTRIVSGEKDWNPDAKRIEDSLSNKAGAPPRQIEALDWFVSGSKRGWALCCLCRKSVWTGSGKREHHLRSCIRAGLDAGPLIV